MQIEPIVCNLLAILFQTPLIWQRSCVGMSGNSNSMSYQWLGAITPLQMHWSYCSLNIQQKMSSEHKQLIH